MDLFHNGDQFKYSFMCISISRSRHVRVSAIQKANLHVNHFIFIKPYIYIRSTSVLSTLPV